MSQSSGSPIFGKRKEQPILILARGEKVHHMTVRPWMTAVGVSIGTLFAIGYLASTSYLVLRDDLIGGTMARQARMQHDYEDRISALRAQVDRVTSRQLLDQQVVEEKVEKLLQQQQALTSRHGKLGSLIERAEDSGLADPGKDKDETEKHADATGGIQAIERLMGLAAKTAPKGPALAYAAPFSRSDPRGGDTITDRADRLFSRVTHSLKDIERGQKDRIASLTSGAISATDAIETIVARTGLSVTPEAEQARATGDTAGQMTETGDTGMGGPYVAPEATDMFDRQLVELDTALVRLEQVRGEVRKLPFSNPAPQSDITSRFGNRMDPFLGRLALHAGIDFRVAIGTSVRSTAPGKVVVAGRNGGYGNMVEIDHGNGVNTRYGHLSTVLVNVGDVVKAGEAIGRSGNTGRSTGPHLHYEVRLHGDAVDPMRFLNAGMKLSSYID
ncbi:murein DD-endopeptidase MepM/ murein hydrolase activator NlpD [Rhizobium sp. PP-F2F-G48]|uniref:M23 family metallopeptidase n=1 Tax=Rhizobium sp. PP-F2F-G48 TaxID=2135651 RepID=UPI0010E2A773|nr:M23 family metallopeptidase [Rhizobium sp. PP-F2F-G48]TCM58958.1 murein DD-endopeptidase MepM/ murein hydrolase activator NlpD [Rhizobium sp. PP-F2F-G48]